MTKIRKETMQKYDIGSHRFMELYYFCLQYNEWRNELEYKTNALKSPEFSQCSSGKISDSTSKLAMRREELRRKCELIEQTAIEVDAELYSYILKAVTNEWVTYKYLKTVMDIPCSRNTWYERRRKFYWLLSKKK